VKCHVAVRLCHSGYVKFPTPIAGILETLREALQLRLKQVERAVLAREARRQSLLASVVITEDERFWETRADTTGWS
jgi:hypothetical protein